MPRWVCGPVRVRDPHTVILDKSRASQRLGSRRREPERCAVRHTRELQGIGSRYRPEEVLMKRLSMAALVGLPILFTAACAGTSHLVGVDNAPGSSVDSTHSSAPVSACENTPRQGNSSVMVDWVDFVQLRGTQYIAGLDGHVPPSPRPSWERWSDGSAVSSTL